PAITKEHAISMALNGKVFSANTPTAWQTALRNIIERREVGAIDLHRAIVAGVVGPSHAVGDRIYSASTASRISSRVTLSVRRAAPIRGVTTNRTFPPSNFLSCGSASKIFARGKFFGNLVGKPNRLRRSIIASR